MGEALGDFLASMGEYWNPEDALREPQGSAFQTLAARTGVPCPPELIVLADEMARLHILSGSWHMLHAAAAEQTQSFLRSHVPTMPCLADRANMLPLFNRDGDLLLLDQDGTIRLFSFGGPEYDRGLAASSFDDLLRRLMMNDKLEMGSGFFTWIWVDEIEYGYTIAHIHEARNGRFGCVTRVIVDLAPHYRRVDGKPHPFQLLFFHEGLTSPRPEPLQILPTSRGPIDLGASDLVTHIIRAAVESGWSGRDEERRIDDAWAELERVLASER